MQPLKLSHTLKWMDMHFEYKYPDMHIMMRRKKVSQKEKKKV